jgi:chromosome segregation ATPase
MVGIRSTGDPTMRRSRYASFVRRFALAAVVALAAAPSAAQPAPVVSDELMKELTAIRAALDKLSAQLEALSRQQELDVLVRRIAVKQDRLLPIEAELREVRNEGKRLSSELEKLDMLETQWKDELLKHGSLETEEATEQTERQLLLLRQRRETLEAQLRANQQRVIDLEARFDETRRDIEAAESLVDERLERSRP